MTFREPSAKGARSPFSKKKHRGSSENEEPLTDGGNSTVQHEPTLARLKEVLTENSSLQHVMLDQAREVCIPLCVPLCVLRPFMLSERSRKA